MIDLVKGDRVERIAVRVGPGGGQKAVEGLAGRRPRCPRRWSRGILRAARSRRASSSGCRDADLAGIAHDEEDLEFLRSLGVRSAITVALQGARQADRGADPRRRLVRPPLRARATSTSPGSSPAGWRWPSTTPASSPTSSAPKRRGRRSPRRCSAACCRRRCPHIPGWSVAALVPAGRGRERGRRRLLRRLPRRRRLDAGDRRRHRPRRAGRLGHRPGPLHAAHRGGADRRPAGRARDPQPRAARPRGDSALCSVAALAISEDPLQPVRLAVAGHPPPLLVDGEAVTEVAGAGPVLGAFADAEWGLDYARRRARAAAGRRHRRDHRGVRAGRALRRGAPAGGAGRRRRPGAGGAAPRRRAARVHRRQARRRRRDPRPRPRLGRVRPAAASRSPRRAGRRRGGVRRRPWMTLPRAGRAPLRRLQPPRRRGDRRALRRGDGVLPAAPRRRSAATRPTSAPRACSDYLRDVARVWEELLITPSEVEQRGDSLLVRGRVYLRSRELGIRDMPVAWIWEMRDGRFIRGEVFIDPEEAVRRSAAKLGQGRVPISRASRSTTRLR